MAEITFQIFTSTADDLHRESKKQDTLCFVKTSVNVNVNRFTKFFYRQISEETCYARH